MRAIITGPTGAVGISLIHELIANDWDIIAVVRPNSARLSAIPNDKRVRIIPCALDHIKDLPSLIAEKCDVFYHFGWDGTYGESRIDLYRQNANVIYTIDAVHVAKELGCSVFVGAGSQSEFGHVDGILSPDMVCNPDNGYGAAKLAACHASRILCSQLNIRHEWCRIVSLYGPFDGSYTMTMSIISTLLHGESPKCTNGDQIWDYIYSKDAARAFRLVAEKGQHGSVYCFGTGKTRKLSDFIKIIQNHINPDLPIQFGAIPYYPNQVMHLEADITNLKEDTGFEPQYSFDDGISETIAWYQETHKGLL